MAMGCQIFLNHLLFYKENTTFQICFILTVPTIFSLDMDFELSKYMLISYYIVELVTNIDQKSHHKGDFTFISHLTVIL